MIPDNIFWQKVQPPAQSDEFPSFEIIRRDRSDKPGRCLIIRDRECVWDGFSGHTILFEPLTYLVMQVGYAFRKFCLESGLQKLTKERVILIPSIDNGDEEIALFNMGKYLVGISRINGFA